MADAKRPPMTAEDVATAMGASPAEIERQVGRLRAERFAAYVMDLVNWYHQDFVTFLGDKTSKDLIVLCGWLAGTLFQSAEPREAAAMRLAFSQTLRLSEMITRAGKEQQAAENPDAPAPANTFAFVVPPPSGELLAKPELAFYLIEPTGSVQ